jgi:hypothetical protein
MVTMIGDLRTKMVELQQDPNWLALVKEMEDQVKAQTEILLNENDPTECIRLQERVKALRFCTRLPQLVAEREEE